MIKKKYYIKADKLPISKRERLAARAKKRRLALKFKRYELAEMLGVSKENMNAMETHLHAFPKDDIETLWENFLKVPHGWLRDESIQTPEVEDNSAQTAPSAPVCNTVVEEIKTAGRWLVRNKVSKRTYTDSDLNDNERRLVDIFAMRYGINGEDFTTLQSIGDSYGVTRERVRQITTKMLERAADLRFATHCIDKISAEILQYLPATIESLDEKFRPILGENLSVSSADRFAREVLGRRIFELTDKPTDMSKPWNVVVIDPNENKPDLIRAVRDAAFKMVRSCGAAHVNFTTGEAAHILGYGVTPDEIIKCCKVIPGFQWLLEDDGWFWFGESNENRVITVAKKVLTIADKKVDVEDMHQAISRSRRSHYEPDRSRPLLVEPPMVVITELMKNLSWVDVIQHNDFILAEDINYEEILSESEIKVFEFLASQSGISSRYAINQRLIKELGMNPMTVSLVLDSSPIINRVDTGIFALRGWTITSDAVSKALSSVGGNSAGYGNDRFLVKMEQDWVTFELTLTEYHLDTRVIDLPSAAIKYVPTGDYKMKGFDIPVTYAVLPSGARRLKKLMNKLVASGFNPKDKIKIRIHPANKLIEAKKISSVNPVEFV
jgi:transcriptional regulator with XRE-family HTH domain